MAKNFASRRPIVGLEIDPSYIAAAEVRLNGSLAVHRGATAMLEPGVIRDGEVTDTDQLAGILKAFFATHNLSNRVRVGVANQRIVVRMMDLPALSDGKELAAAVRFQAEDQIPMPLDKAVLDHQSLGVVETPDGPRLRVLVVAARRDMIERLLTAVRRAGLRPEGIDLSAFAMVRALRPSAEQSGVVLYLNGGGLTNIAVADGASCLFTRVAASGLEWMVTRLAERGPLTLEHARAWLSHVGLASPLDDVEGDPQMVANTRGVLDDGVRRIADDVRKSLEFYAAQESGPPVERVMLTGPAASIPGFAEDLSRQLRLPVDPGAVAESRPGALSGGHGASFSVAAGLAVSEVPA